MLRDALQHSSRPAPLPNISHLLLLMFIIIFLSQHSYSLTVSYLHVMQGRMGAEWMDETDCVGSWQNERLAAVMFPTADTLTQVRQLARVKGPHRLMLLINPQWQTGGQIVSDFG